jgi:ribokinase
VLQLEIPLATVQRAADAAHSNGARVILNPAPARHLPDELLRQVDFLIPNETEAALLTGGDAALPQDSARALRDQGVESVIVTLGAQGAMVVNRHGDAMIEAFPVAVVDTTAAGDAFVGAFAVALAEGKSTCEAVRWANAAGALATTKLGAQPSLPTYAAVAEFVNNRAAGERAEQA